MHSRHVELGPFRIVSAGHAALAAIMIWLGVMGITTGNFEQVWLPVPKWLPAHSVMAYLFAAISLGTGIGLLLRSAAAIAARVLFASLAVWLLATRLPNLFYEKPLVLVAWTFGATAVMTAAAWVLYVWFAGGKGIRVAQALYGVSLIPFGLAHFMYLDATTVLIPHWMPWHVALAYLTGAAFIAAGLAIAIGVLGRLAAALSTLQLALFGLIVWMPRALSGPLNDFQWGEFVEGWALTAAAWVVAESFGRRHDQ